MANIERCQKENIRGGTQVMAIYFRYPVVCSMMGVRVRVFLPTHW